LSEQDNQPESASPARPAEEETVGHEQPVAETSTAEAPGAEPIAAGTEEKKEEEKPPVRYELLEATPRASSIVDIKFKVPYAEYDLKTQDFYKDLRQTVIIDGFRRGKAPLKLIQNRYHKEVKQDALDYLLANCAEQIATEKKYKALRDFDRVDPEVVEGEELVFAISMEVYPQIEPQGYDQFDVTVDAHEINEAAVEAEIEKLRRRHGTYQAAELLAYQTGHGVVLDIRVADDKGHEIAELTRKELFFTHLERSLPEPVAQQLLNQRAGDSFVVNLPNPRRSEGGVITSEQDTYHVKVREVRREILPELNDEFARDVGGFDTVQALRDHIRKTMEGQEEQRVRELALEKIYEQLFERNPFDVPPTLVAEFQEMMIREHEARLAKYGLRLEDIGNDPKEYVLRTQKNAERMARLMLLNHAIAEKEKIVATDADVDRAIAKQAEEEGRRPLAIRARLEARRELGKFRDDLKYDLVNDMLLSHARISKQVVAAEPKIVTRLAT
jgi:trigger factor